MTKNSEMSDDVFNKIIEMYGDTIYTITINTIQDEIAAQDVVQEIFIKIFKGLPSFRGDAKISTWIYRITKNACYNYYKREKKLQMWNQLEMTEGIISQDDPAQKYDKIQEREQLITAISQLPPVYRLAIYLYYFNDLSYKDTAAIMELPINTLKSYIHRAKKQLAEILDYEK